MMGKTTYSSGFSMVMMMEMMHTRERERESERKDMMMMKGHFNLDKGILTWIPA
jgi:hypothetical protein